MADFPFLAGESTFHLVKKQRRYWIVRALVGHAPSCCVANSGLNAGHRHANLVGQRNEAVQFPVEGPVFMADLQLPFWIVLLVLQVVQGKILHPRLHVMNTRPSFSGLIMAQEPVYDFEHKLVNRITEK